MNDLNSALKAFFDSGTEQVEGSGGSSFHVLPLTLRLGFRCFDKDVKRDDGEKGMWTFHPFNEKMLTDTPEGKNAVAELQKHCQQIAQKNEENKHRRVYHAVEYAWEVTEFLTRDPWNVPEERKVMRTYAETRRIPYFMTKEDWLSTQLEKAEMGGRADTLEGKFTAKGLDGTEYVQVWGSPAWKRATELMSPGKDGEPPVIPHSMIGKRIWVKANNFPIDEFLENLPNTWSRWTCAVARDGEGSYDQNGNEIPLVKSFNGDVWLRGSGRQIEGQNTPSPRFVMTPIGIVADNEKEAREWVAENMPDAGLAEGEKILTASMSEDDKKTKQFGEGLIALLNSDQELLDDWKSALGTSDESVANALWIDTITDFLTKIDGGTPPAMAIKDWNDTVRNSNGELFFTVSSIDEFTQLRDQVFGK